METQILIYSRRHGLFAGIDLGGYRIEQDKDSTIAMYGKDVTNSDIFAGKVRVPVTARPFINEVARVKTEAKSNLNRLLNPARTSLCRAAWPGPRRKTATAVIRSAAKTASFRDNILRVQSASFTTAAYLEPS
jgi:hypothetical protein